MSNTISIALVKVLPTLESAKKNAANPHLKSKYANISAVMAAVEPIKEHGLWYRQKSHFKPDGACVETIYIHEDGSELSAGETFVKADKQTAQGFGSAMTYARRYSLQCAFGLDAEDDDGHQASTPPKPKTITEEQRTELMALLNGMSMAVEPILAQARKNTGQTIKDLSELPASEYDGLAGFLKSKSQKENTNA